MIDIAGLLVTVGPFTCRALMWHSKNRHTPSRGVGSRWPACRRREQYNNETPQQGKVAAACIIHQFTRLTKILQVTNTIGVHMLRKFVHKDASIAMRQMLVAASVILFGEEELPQAHRLHMLGLQFRYHRHFEPHMWVQDRDGQADGAFYDVLLLLLPVLVLC